MKLIKYKKGYNGTFGVRCIPELEQTFLYLCIHDCRLLDMSDLFGNLETYFLLLDSNFIGLIKVYSRIMIP
ncbi:hypothetical protein FQU71_15410 [Legionella longbeachae]|nr:hypothetical protein FQU71_15410 [Legionella longbeachae]